MRRPKPAEVVDSIKEGIFKVAKSEYCDVTLISSDGQKMPAARVLLALRSTFFDRLFFSDFSEKGRTEVKVEVSGKALREVIEFIYTDDTETMRVIDNAIRQGKKGYVDRRKAWRKITCEVVMNVVEIAAAADYLQMETLTKWACSCVMGAIRVNRSTCCAGLERIMQLRVACEPLIALKKDVMEYVVRYWMHLFQVVELGKGKGMCSGVNGGCTVLHFSTESFETLFNGLLKIPGYNKSCFLFEVVYYWGTAGKDLLKTDNLAVGCLEELRMTEKDARKNRAKAAEMGNVEVADGERNWAAGNGEDGDAEWKNCERWNVAQRIAKQLKPGIMQFIVEHVEKTGLLSKDELYSIYRAYASSSTEDHS